MGSLFGQMEGLIKETGIMVNKMEKESMLLLMAVKNMESGKKGRE